MFSLLNVDIGSVSCTAKCSASVRVLVDDLQKEPIVGDVRYRTLTARWTWVLSIGLNLKLFTGNRDVTSHLMIEKFKRLTINNKKHTKINREKLNLISTQSYIHSILYPYHCSRSIVRDSLKKYENIAYWKLEGDNIPKHNELYYLMIMFDLLCNFNVKIRIKRKKDSIF